LGRILGNAWNALVCRQALSRHRPLRTCRLVNWPLIWRGRHASAPPPPRHWGRCCAAPAGPPA